MQPTSGFEDFIAPDLENIKNKLTVFSKNEKLHFTLVLLCTLFTFSKEIPCSNAVICHIIIIIIIIHKLIAFEGKAKASRIKAVMKWWTKCISMVIAKTASS